MDTEATQEKMKEGAQQAQSRAREQIDQRSTQAGEPAQEEIQLPPRQAPKAKDRPDTA